MSVRRRLLDRLSGPKIAALLAGLTALYHLGTELRLEATGRTSLHQRLELTALDVKLAARGDRPPDRWAVAIAGADEKSLDRFGPLPWSRRRHAELVDRLTELGAAAIAFDMTFERGLEPPDAECGRDGDRRGREGPDDELARVLRSSGRAILGVVALSKAEAVALGTGLDRLRERLATIEPALLTELVEDLPGGLSTFHPAGGAFLRGAYRRYFGLAVPTSTLARAAGRFGALNAAPDGDGVNRGLPLVLAFDRQDVLLPTLALEAVAVALDADIEVLGHPSDPAAHAVRVGARTVEIGLGGGVLLDWYGGLRGAGLPLLSIADLLDGRVPREEVEGRIVFVAATAIGTHDQRVTPLERAAPGVYIHATLAQNLIDGRHLTRPAWVIAVELLIIGLVGLVTAIALTRVGGIARVGSGLLMVVGWVALDQAVLLERGLVVHTLLPSGQVFLTLLALSVHGYLKEERARRETRAAFGRYLSPRVMEQVLSDPVRHLRLGGQRYDATVLFSDIRGFTSISESLEPEVLGRMLNQYMTPMTRIVFAEEGTLDKYIGDAIMAFWGAPIPQPDHALRACRAALDMLAELEHLNPRFEAAGLPRIAIGIGLSSGPMTIGNMGSDEFFAFTALGDRVNLGARLEGQTKSYGVSVIVCEATYAAVRNHMLCRELDLLRVKGKRAPERIYELIGPIDRVQDRLRFVEAFEAALRAFRARRFGEAERGFENARTLAGDDRCSEQYRDLSAYLRLHPPPDDWDGVREATTK